MLNDTLSHLKQPPSPQPNLKSNIVTGLLLLLGEKGEKNYCKKKTCHLLQSVLKCKMKPIVKNIEIICLYNIRPRVGIKIVRFLSPKKFERFQRPIKNDRTEENSTAKYDGKHYFRCPFSRFIDIRNSGILRIFFNVSKEGFLEA